MKTNQAIESFGDNTTTVTSKRADHNARLHHGGYSISNKHAVTLVLMWIFWYDND